MGDLNVYDSCFRFYFANGDLGFYYENEAFIMKLRGDIWIKNDSENFFHSMSPSYGYAKIFDDGSIQMPILKNGYSLWMDG